MTERTLLYDNERLDIPDAQSLQELVYEYLQRAVGALYAGQSGCLGKFTYGTGSLPLITLESPMYFVYSPLADGTTAGTAAPGTGRIIRFDPALAWQGATSFSIAAFSAPDTFTVWARAVTANDAQETRREWDETLGSETTFNPFTRAREKVEFAASVSQPAGTGWFPIALGGADGWASPTEPSFRTWHALDDFTYASVAEARTADYLTERSGDFSTFGNLGIGKVVASLVQVVHDMKTAGGGANTSWISALTGRGLNQLEDDLTALETVVSTDRQIAAHGRIIKTGPGTFNVSSILPAGSVAVNPISTGIIEIVVTGFQVTSVQAIGMLNTLGGDATKPYTVQLESDGITVVVTTVTTSTFRLAIYDGTGTLVDQSVMLTCFGTEA